MYFSAVEYGMNNENLSISAIRTIRVLRPLRAINRIPSKYIPYSLSLSYVYLVKTKTFSHNLFSCNLYSALPSPGESV